ncbi:MAG: sigma-70 family RNA polymerase sigma factor, partial [Pirellulaceae bacterium]
MSADDSTLPTRYELTDPDVRLMLQVRDGSAAAFEELVHRYQTRLTGILEHLVPGQGQAEDLAQEVFMRVYRARESYQPTAKFSTWLFTIANNVASNAIRKLVRRKEINLQTSPSGQNLARPLDDMAKAASG